MGEKDITEKLLEDYNDVFADIVNVLFFKGREVLKENSLESAGTHSQYKSDDSKVHELERDVIKYWKDGNVRIALFGIENQTAVDKFMPFRVLAYDGASYKNQLTAGFKSMLPVVTFVLYFGKERWKGPKNLKACLNIPKELETYVNDYNINVFEIAWLSDEQIQMFKSDFKVVAEYFVQKRIDPNHVSGDKTIIKHIDEVLKLLSAFTGDHRFEQIIDHPGHEEVNTMCEVLDNIWNDGMTKGLEKGKAEGIAITLYSLVRDGDLSIEKASARMKISVSEFEKLMSDAGF